MSTAFKKGQAIVIRENLLEELLAAGMDQGEATAFSNHWSSKRCVVLDTWQDGVGRHWVTVDLCCEIPFQCCKLDEDLNKEKR